MYQALCDTTMSKRTQGPCFYAAVISGEIVHGIFFKANSSCYLCDLDEYANYPLSRINCSLLFSLNLGEL